MKKALILTLMVLLLVLTGCQTSQDSPASPEVEAALSPAEKPEGIPLLIELRTGSTWSDLKILNPDLILYAEVASLIGEPAYFDLDNGSIALEQSSEGSESGEQVGLIASLILDERAVDEDIDLEFDLTKGCANQSLVSIYGIVEDQPRLIFQRELSPSDDCGGLAFNVGLGLRLEAMEKMGGTSFVREEAEFVELEPPTIQNGLEFELLTRSDTLYIEYPDLPPYEVLAQLGEPTLFGHGDGYVIDLNQPESEAEVGKWMGARIRLEFDFEAEEQALDFTLFRGCLNETIMNVYKVVDGERVPILNQDRTLSTTIYECADPVPFTVDLEDGQVSLRAYVLENINFDQGDLEAEGQIFLEAELNTNSNWTEILSDDESIISADLISVSGDPTRVNLRTDMFGLDQPTSSAGSAIEVGATARYGFIPQGEDHQVTFKLQNGPLNQATVRFFAHANGKRIPISLRDGQESLTVYGSEAQEFIINLDAVQAMIIAAELYDDLPLVAHLSDIRGEVLVRQPGMEEFFPAREGAPVNVGGEVLTGANSEVYLSISDGAVIRLGPNTIFGLEMGISSVEIVMPRFRLELGEMEVVSGSDGFLVITPENVLGAIGSSAYVFVSPGGETEMSCLAGDCFRFGENPNSTDLKDALPEAVKAAVEKEESSLSLNGDSEDNVDRDGDGVPNDLDTCPENGDRGYGIDALGCPINNYISPSIDTDGDGYPDDQDLCPDVSGVSYIDLYGNPVVGDYGCKIGDDDYDGVVDSLEDNSDSDEDGDGINDSLDLCPDNHGSKLFQGCPLGDFDHDGIPDNEEDTDHDGIPDSEDICPMVSGRYEILDGDEWPSYRTTESGCPLFDDNHNGIVDHFESSTHVDSDGDSVVNADDDCILQGLPANGLGVDEHGCPNIDTDGDGVVDSKDSCRQIPDMGFGLDSTGCPIHPDSDNDGIPDYLDLCFDEDQPVYGVDSNGCPIQIIPADSNDWDGDGYSDGEDRCPLVYVTPPMTHDPRDYNYGCPIGDYDFNGIPDHRECSPDEICNDRDGDGWEDDVDLCPDVYQIYPPSSTGKTYTSNGCPLGDFDHNGVPDHVECDGCTPPRSEGVPEICLDRDGDGICVEDDLCPTQSGTPEDNGCPVTQDWDGDGVPDSIDRCPTVYGPDLGIDSMASVGCPYGDYDFDGVPDTYECSSDDCFDIDGDGIPDVMDECPNAYGFSGDRDNRGVRTEESKPDVDGNWLPVGEYRWYDASGNSNGCPAGDNDQNGIPDNVECGDCESPDTQDWDGDGVLDQFDDCPLVYAPAYYDMDGNFLSDIASGCPPGDEDFDGVPDHLECSSSFCEDRDGDGIPDEEDMCPDHFGFANQEPFSTLWDTSNGCPYGDNDYDGIPDDLECEDCDLPTSDSDGDEISDSDADGIDDLSDHCKYRGDEGGGVDEVGCPYILDCEPDSQDYDGDGYADCLDFCPTTYAQKLPTQYYPPQYQGSPLNPLDWHGCPPGDSDYDGIPDGSEYGEDRDGDGLRDEHDQCPDQYAERVVCLSGGVCFDRQTNFNGCVYDDEDLDGIPDDKECVGCAPPGSQDDPVICLDYDQDSLCDRDDDCPFVSGSLANKGCKDGDSDGDGVRDGADLCPGAVVDPLHGVTPLGCPRAVTARVDSSSAGEITTSSPVTGDEISLQAPTLQLELVADKDSDGYADAIDKCPAKGDQGYGLDLNGCPLPPPPEDSDGDGFADDHDNCPNEGDQGYGLGRTGCPLPPPADSDGDGIIDTEDACPNTGDQGAGLRDNGCPVAEKATADPDGDGVVGALDKCPNQGGNVGLDGCPKTESDSDSDGVPDSQDACPNQGSDGYGVSSNGCALKPPDSDGDGVADNQDKCPNKGNQGYGLTAEGCPQRPPDSDGDGVTDDKDRCPNKGDEGDGIDKGGCPLKPAPLPVATQPAQDSSLVLEKDEEEDSSSEKDTGGRSQDPTPEPN